MRVFKAEHFVGSIAEGMSINEMFDEIERLEQLDIMTAREVAQLDQLRAILVLGARHEGEAA